MFINLSASLGDIGFIGHWTIQLFAIHPIRVYAGMCIGQMMFWHTQGHVELYNGKYQGATGAMASRIFVDFDEKMSHGVHREPDCLENSTFGFRFYSMHITDLPSKFHNLVLLENDVSVPACVCLGTAELSRASIDNFIEIVDAAGRVLDRINRTSATFLGEDLAEIQDIIGALSPSQIAESKLLDLFRPCFGTDCMDEAFAVRSANTIEDRSSKSFAGLYDTFLDMRGCSELLRAIRAVWMSAYSRAVITERIHAGLLNDSNPMNVIIQRMVPAAYAGVAFSRHPVTGDECDFLVEIVDGRGDSLVSGRNAGDHYAIGRRHPDTAPTARNRNHQPILEAVTSILLHVERRMGPVDIEWAWDGQTAWLLQARPITSLDRAESRDKPIFLVTDLYA